MMMQRMHRALDGEAQRSIVGGACGAHAGAQWGGGRVGVVGAVDVPGSKNVNSTVLCRGVGAVCDAAPFIQFKCM